MASAGSILVDPDHLAGGDGTVTEAMRLWSCRTDPVQYNEWQSLYFHLVRAGYSDAEAPEDESAKDRQARIGRMCREIQEEIHGPDYLALAVKAKKKAGGAAMPEREGQRSSMPVRQITSGWTTRLNRFCSNMRLSILSIQRLQRRWPIV